MSLISAIHNTHSHTSEANERKKLFTKRKIKICGEKLSLFLRKFIKKQTWGRIGTVEIKKSKQYILHLPLYLC